MLFLLEWVLSTSVLHLYAATEETAYLSFKAKPEFNLPEGKSFYNASLVYQVQPPVSLKLLFNLICG